MKRILIILIGTFIFSFIYSQTITDALRYSYLSPAGSARTLGVGGAIGALGADYSVLSINPAGLATFRKSEFSITPGYFISSTNSILDGENNETQFDEKRKLSFNSAGLVTVAKPSGSNLKNLNFSVGLNKQASFVNNFYYDGKSKGSITDRFLEQVNGQNIDAFEAQIALDANALYDLNEDGFYESDFNAVPDTLVHKFQTVNSSGSINEMVIGLAGNYNDKIMFGATVAFPFLYFSETKKYSENDPDNTIPFFNELEFNENLVTSGIGVNMKLGFIYNINKLFRLGLAYHTPTLYSLEDDYHNTFIYDYTDAEHDGPIEAVSPDGIWEYKLKTPGRVVGSAGIVFGKKGFLSADVEYVDYTSMSFHFNHATGDSDKQLERELNDKIKKEYTEAVNIRLGGEYSYEIFRFRAGYGINGTPYAGDNIVRDYYTLGVGIRQNGFYLDVAYRNAKIDQGYIPYLTSQAVQQFVDNDITNKDILVTFGVKF